eukprot:1039496-Pleurochrysis_carterae.AAC.1
MARAMARAMATATGGATWCRAPSTTPSSSRPRRARAAPTPPRTAARHIQRGAARRSEAQRSAVARAVQEAGRTTRYTGRTRPHRLCGHPPSSPLLLPSFALGPPALFSPRLSLCTWLIGLESRFHRARPGHSHAALVAKQNTR